MAVKYVRELLSDEILLALAGLKKPATGGIFTIIKKGELLGNQESFDSRNSPSVIVMWPELVSVTPVTQETSHSIYAVDIFVHDSNVDPTNAEKKASEYECKIRVALASYTSAALSRTGYGCGNNISFESTGWTRRGQDTMYQMTATFDLYVPATQLVNV